jgi:hypothetical protein
MAEAKRISLDGALEGHHVMVNEDAVTMGFLEDIQTSRASVLLDALAGAVVGGELPHGTDRAGLRKLSPEKFAALLKGVTASTDIPKAS